MVGGLVEEQHVGVLQQEPGERDAHHPAAGEGADVLLHVRIGESEPAQDAARLRLHAIAAERLEPMLEPAVLVHQLGELGLVLGVGQLQLDVPHAALDAAHLARARHHLRHDAATLALGDLLPQVADGEVASARHRPGIGFLVAGDDLEQRRLAGTVRPDDRHAATGADLQADVAEQVLRGVALRHAAEGHEAHGPPMVAAEPLGRSAAQPPGALRSCRTAAASPFPAGRTRSRPSRRRARRPGSRRSRAPSAPSPRGTRRRRHGRARGRSARARRGSSGCGTAGAARPPSPRRGGRRRRS